MAGKLWDKTLAPDGSTHTDWLAKNAHLYTMDQLCEALARSRSAVKKKLRELGLTYRGQIEVIGNEKIASEVEGISIDSLLQFMKDEPRTVDDFSAEFDRSPDTMRRAIEQLLELSYEISQTEGRRHVWSTKVPKIVAPPTILWDKAVWEFKLGIMADWHDGSKAAQISARNKAIEVMYNDGVRDIIVVGDINAGHKVYRGQELDIVSDRPDHQTAITETYCPRYDGLRYHIMGGNHDYSFIKEGGHNALKALCGRREDFLYYGYDLVTIPLTENVDALAWHPRGGQAYAMSYKSQKMVEQLAFAELMEVIEKNATPKVRFLFVGHWHSILMNYEKGPIHIEHPGCFEGQNNLSRQKGWFPELAAVILEGKITKDRNLIRDLTSRRLRFTEIPDDYLNYPVPAGKEDEKEQLFKWRG